MEIRITFAPDGTITTKVVDGCGKSCTDATKALRDAIGVTTEDRKLPEYYEQEKAANQNKAGRS